MCMNVYDVRLLDVSPACGMNWPPPLPDVATYLGVGPFRDFCCYDILSFSCSERRLFEPSTPTQNQNHGLSAVAVLAMNCGTGIRHLR